MVIPGKLSFKTLAVIASVEAKAESTSFLNRMSQFLEQLHDKVKRDISITGSESPSETLDVKAFERLVKNSNYATLSPIAIYRPTGMRGGYVDYVAMLSDYQHELGDIEKRLLTPLKRTVSLMLSDPARLKQAFPRNYKTVDVDQLKAKFNVAVDVDDKGDAIAYGDAVTRNADWKGIVGSINTLDEQYQRNSNRDLLDSVGELTEYLTVLLERIKDQPDVYNYKGSTISDLVDIIYHAAREVELYGIHGFNLATGKKALVDSFKALKEAI